MKIKLKNEEFLESLEYPVMKRFKAGSVFEDAEMIESNFFGTETKKIILLMSNAGKKYRFEEWEPNIFHSIFEIL